MKIRITSDSTCDLSAELIKKYGITILPLYIVKDGKSYRDGIDIVPQDIYDHVEAGGSSCTTWCFLEAEGDWGCSWTHKLPLLHFCSQRAPLDLWRRHS